MAGNQLGKTLAGAAEAAMHLTGRYPDWWQGRQFDKPIVMLAGSESYELTRDGVQRLLIGPPLNDDDWGTGFIPKATIVATTRRSGASGALDSVTVRHVSGGTSTLLFKAYEQGRGKWQANTVDYVWFDEEPPEDVYFEGITRTNATRGSIAVTFTPLKGLSAVVARYLMEKSPDREVITMTIDDAEHYTPEERQRIIASYPAHEREARTKGVPALGGAGPRGGSDRGMDMQLLGQDRRWCQVGLKPVAARNRANAMKNLRCISLFLIAVPLVLASCSETAVPTAPARGSVKLQPAGAQPVAKPGPRQCTTPEQVCPYGTGPAGEPCSCWATDGSPDIGITTIEAPASRPTAPNTSQLYKG